MDFDFNLERIENGFIATGNDSTKVKMYYPSLSAMIESLVVERVKELDKYFREHETNGSIARLRVNFDHDK